jgi:hypothetical protein
MRAVAICVLAFACNGDDDPYNRYPPNAPGFDGFSITVTEGSSTSFPVYSAPWPPTISAGFMIGVDFPDMSIVNMSPGGGGWGPASAPPIITVTGIDDGSAETADRNVSVGGAVLDCGSLDVGSVHVVDRESLQINASPWELYLAVGSSATLTIALTQAPGSDVTVAIGSSSNVTIDPQTVTLDATNWSIGAPVTVTAVALGHRSWFTLDAGSDLQIQGVSVDVDP